MSMHSEGSGASPTNNQLKCPKIGKSKTSKNLSADQPIGKDEEKVCPFGFHMLVKKNSNFSDKPEKRPLLNENPN